MFLLALFMKGVSMVDPLSFLMFLLLGLAMVAVLMLRRRQLLVALMMYLKLE